MSHQMDILFTSGFRVRVTIEGLLHTFRHRWAMFYFAAVITILCATCPFTDFRAIEPWRACLVWAIDVIIAIFLINVIILGLYFSQKFKTVHASFISLCVTIPYVLFSKYAAIYAGGIFSADLTSPAVFLFDFIILEAGVQFFGSYLVPKILVDSGLKHLIMENGEKNNDIIISQGAEIDIFAEVDFDVNSEAGTTIEIDRKVFYISNIRYLKAQENYIFVATKMGNELLRGRITEVSDAISPEYGCQVHRSYWVSKFAVENIRRVPGNLEIKIKNDELFIPVSRSRRTGVMLWLRKHRHDLFGNSNENMGL